MVHIRHTRVYIFYTELDNKYPSRISAHGTKYSHRFHSTEQTPRIKQISFVSWHRYCGICQTRQVMQGIQVYAIVPGTHY